MSKPDMDLPATLRPRLIPPSDSVVLGWFTRTRWFTPSDGEIADFSSFLRHMTVHAQWQNWHRKNGLDEHSAWQKAVQTLRDTLPAVIPQIMALENEFGSPATPESRSAQLARLLIAAQETYIVVAPGATSILDGKNDHAATIASYITTMAQRAGAQIKNHTHRNSPLLRITESAMETCGFAGAVNAAALAADFKLNGLDPKQRRKSSARGKKTS